MAVQHGSLFIIQKPNDQWRKFYVDRKVIVGQSQSTYLHLNFTVENLSNKMSKKCSIKLSPLFSIDGDETGSALFFRKCGDSCQLDSVTRTELSVSDCRFEEETRFPGSSFLDWINRFALPNPNAASGGSEDEEDGEGSEPERGDLPQKILPSSTTTSRTSEDFDINFDADSVGAGLLPDEGPSASSGAAGNAGIDPFEYDYEENHREEVGGGSTILKDILGEGRKRRRRTAPHRRPQLGDIDSSWSHHLDEEFNVNEKDELPRTTSPHICFTSGDAASTTTCK